MNKKKTTLEKEIEEEIGYTKFIRYNSNPDRVLKECNGKCLPGRCDNECVGLNPEYHGSIENKSDLCTVSVAETTNEK